MAEVVRLRAELVEARGAAAAAAGALTIANTTNNNNTVNNTINIYNGPVNNYGQEQLDHLTPDQIAEVIASSPDGETILVRLALLICGDPARFENITCMSHGQEAAIRSNGRWVSEPLMRVQRQLLERSRQAAGGRVPKTEGRHEGEDMAMVCAGVGVRKMLDDNRDEVTRRNGQEPQVFPPIDEPVV